MGQEALAQLLRRLPGLAPGPHPLSGPLGYDAALYRLSPERALVQTVDFFTPIVDDPFTFGQIAAANALSDIYAMGGRPLTALNVLGVPTDKVPPQAILAILRGGLHKAREAHCQVVGGHTIRLPEPVYGMAVTGVVSPRKVLANTAARPGDWLVLTKPLGTGIVATGIKHGLASPNIQRKAIRSMLTLNRIGARLAEKSLVRAGTDVTGFGLLGHLHTLCRASQVGAELNAAAVPVLGDEVFSLIARDCIPRGSRQNRTTAATFTDWGPATDDQQTLLTDAQTSGGLLLCVPPKHLESVLKLLRLTRSPCAAVIGRIVSSKSSRISVVSASPARNGHRRKALSHVATRAVGRGVLTAPRRTRARKSLSS